MAILRLLQVQTIPRPPPHTSTTILVTKTRAPARILIIAVLSIVTTTVSTIVIVNAAFITPLSPCASPCALQSLPPHLATLPLHNPHPSRRTQIIAELTRPSHQHHIVHDSRLYAGTLSVVTTIHFPDPECQRRTRAPSMSISLTAFVTTIRSAVKVVQSMNTLATQVTEPRPLPHVLTCVVSTQASTPLMLHALQLPRATHSTLHPSSSLAFLFSDSRYAISRVSSFSKAHQWHITFSSRFVASFLLTNMTSCYS